MMNISGRQMWVKDRGPYVVVVTLGLGTRDGNMVPFYFSSSKGPQVVSALFSSISSSNRMYKDIS